VDSPARRDPRETRNAPATRRLGGLQLSLGARTAESACLVAIRSQLADMPVRAPFNHEIHRQLSFGGLEVLCNGRRNDTLGFRRSFLQSAGRFTLIGFVLGTNLTGVFVARTGFAERTKMAFGRAFEEGLKERGSDFHGWSILPPLRLPIPLPNSRTWLSALLSWPLADALPPVFEPFQIFLGIRHPVGQGLAAEGFVRP